MDRIIYFDNNATTKPLEEVIEAMLPFLHGEYANPSSVHQFGQRVKHQVEIARERVARLIGAKPREITFTSCGTESINLAIRGLLAARPERRHVITSAVEHNAVRKVCSRLADDGCEVEAIDVDAQGRLDLAEFESTLRDETGLVTFMYANNETGVLFPIQQIAEICSDRGVPLHVDAVQAAGKVPIDVEQLPATLLSMSAHKFHGPKGAGALFIRRRTRISPHVLGGSQERNLRGGTEHVPGIIGMGVAAEAAMNRTAEAKDRVRALRDRLEAGLTGATSTAHVIGGGAERIYNTANIAFEGLEAEAVLILLSEAGVCVSSGSACSSGSLEPSHVLAAMGIPSHIAHGAIRFSLSHFNTEEEVDRVVTLMPSILERLSTLSRR
jgi:cysteine desulfurase